MTTRTFIQRGQAYGSTPVSIIAKINDVEVFNGPVPTLNTAYKITGFESTEWLANGIELFSWQDDVEFSGTKTMEITISSGSLVVMDTVADYCLADNKTSHGPVFVNVVDGITYTRTTTNITINGVLQDQNNGSLGQTYWLIPSGGTYTCTVNVTSGILPTPPATP
jgi:hypothetical protein